MAEEFNLKRDVLQKGRCTLCGACLDWCPYLRNLEDHLVMPFDCIAEEGRCIAVCPQIPTDWEEVRKHFEDAEEADPDLGRLFGIYKVRAAKGFDNRQNGGTVSALIAYGLDSGLAGAALLTRSGKGAGPEAFWAKSPEDIREAAGSRYLAVAGLRLLNDGTQPVGVPVMIVGRPCQIRALRKIQIHDAYRGVDRKILAIGLFCTWQLAWSFRDFLAAEYSEKPIRRIAVPRHGLEVDFGEGPRPVSMDAVRKHILPGCHYCSDMSSELADLSVGAFEQEEGWNTLIVRNKAGLDWLDGAKNRGDLLIEEYPEEEFQRLKQAAHNKAKRALEKIHLETVRK